LRKETSLHFVTSQRHDTRQLCSASCDTEIASLLSQIQQTAAVQQARNATPNEDGRVTFSIFNCQLSTINKKRGCILSDTPSHK